MCHRPPRSKFDNGDRCSHRDFDCEGFLEYNLRKCAPRAAELRVVMSCGDEVDVTVTPRPLLGATPGCCGPAAGPAAGCVTPRPSGVDWECDAIGGAEPCRGGSSG